MALSDQIMFHPKTITWNGHTFDNSNGGLVVIEYEIDGEFTGHKSGDDIIERLQAMVGKTYNFRLSVSDFFPVPDTDVGVKSNITFTSKGEASQERDFSITNLKLKNLKGNNQKGIVSGSSLEFIHESADGTSAAMTETTSS